MNLNKSLKGKEKRKRLIILILGLRDRNASYTEKN